MWLGLRKPGIYAQNTYVQKTALIMVIVYGQDIL